MNEHSHPGYGRRGNGAAGFCGVRSAPIYRAAYIDDTERYRYALSRWWGYVPPEPGRWPGRAAHERAHTGSVLGIMLNPSIANGEIDDPTIRRWTAFVKSWGCYTSFTIANLFAYRATQPASLLSADDPVGQQNDAWLERLIATHNKIVCAWGVGPNARGNKGWERFENRATDVEIMIRKAGKIPMCWGFTKSGHPRHPLYLKSNEPLLWMPVRGQGSRAA